MFNKVFKNEAHKKSSVVKVDNCVFVTKACGDSDKKKKKEVDKGLTTLLRK